MNIWKKLLQILFLISLVLAIDTNNNSYAIASSRNYFLAQVNSNVVQELYIENCGSCHIPIPAQVLPTESWQKILEQPLNHYGQSLPKSINLTTRLIWTYLRTYSRPSIEGEAIPEYITNSRYFKALHPQVDLPKPVNSQSCAVCHPSATKLDYRTLSSQWEG